MAKLKSVLGNRNRNALEAERDAFEKNQAISISKAMSVTEGPVKEKHLRSIIMGTHFEQGCGIFWSTIGKMPLQGNPMVAWKFCHIFHKVLREGHPNCIKESLQYSDRILELGKLWGHLRDGYGKLIQKYTQLLVQKLQFHKKNPAIPGNLEISENSLYEITNNDPNAYFALSVEMMDYMDDIISLQAVVFGSMDMARANSMTVPGQCRLAPLIMAILDSCQLYDYVVRMLFKLHSAVPADLLSGHRDRFKEEFTGLKKFYVSSQNLQFYKTLIKVPVLPERMPDFVVYGNLDSHVKPVAEVHEVAPEPEPDEPGESLPPEPTEGTLVDITSPDVAASSIHSMPNNASSSPAHNSFSPSPPPHSSLPRPGLVHSRDELPPPPPHNGEFSSPESKAQSDELAHSEKNTLIEELLAELECLKKQNEDLRKQLEYLKRKLTEEKDELRLNVQDLEYKVEQKKEAVEGLRQENDELQQRLTAQAAAEQEASQDKERVPIARFQAAEKSAKSADEKFKKMKVIYDQLKDQHVALIRKNAEVNKLLQREKEEKDVIIQGKEDELRRLRDESSVVKESLQKTSDQSSQALTAAEIAKTVAINQQKDLETKLKEIENKKEDAETQLKAVKEELTSVLIKIKEHDNATETIAREQESRESELESSRSKIRELSDLLESKEFQHDAYVETKEKEMKDNLAQILAAALSKSEETIRNSLEKDTTFDPSTQTSFPSCSPDYFQSRLDVLESYTDRLKSSSYQLLHPPITTDDEVKSSTGASSSNISSPPSADEVSQFVQSLVLFSSTMSDLTSQARSLSITATSGSSTTTGSSPDETAITAAAKITKGSQSCSQSGLTILSSISKKEDGSSGYDDVAREVANLREAATSLQHLQEMADEEDVQKETLEALVNKEMTSTTEAIDEAARKMAEMLAQSESEFSGLELEVNSKILDSCLKLMNAIKELLQTSRQLQTEIVAEGKGTATDMQFYKQHSRWSEGLISASKEVGFGANFLVEMAEKVLANEGKYEELMVASSDIASSTAHLVVASKVKARSDSQSLTSLSEASKHVTEATGHVVAATKSAAQKLDEKDTWKEVIDKITLGQAKRIMMQSKVKVLELDSQLQKERERLSAISRKMYHLAGEEEGWDDETIAEMIKKDQTIQSSASAGASYDAAAVQDVRIKDNPLSIFLYDDTDLIEESNA